MKKVSVSTVIMTFYIEMKERSKVKVEEQKKTHYILHLEYSWIREFVKIGIFYTKIE